MATPKNLARPRLKMIASWVRRLSGKIPICKACLREGFRRKITGYKLKIPMNFAITLFLLALLSFRTAAADTNPPPVIPLPCHIERGVGVFRVTPSTRIFADIPSRDVAGQLAGRLRAATGYPLHVTAEPPPKNPKDVILLTLQSSNTSTDSEAYELTVSTNAIRLGAQAQAGLFYGVQTLLQLLPPEVFRSSPVSGMDWSIPSVEIHDHPRYAWRGMMLDVGRHFIKADEIKRMLDLMALHKLNTFHWHLVDDQGWRIQIKKYPRLTEVGAWRDTSPPYGDRHSDDGLRHGGFYTQTQIREIVAYAAALHIRVIPEIEMPGHAAAAIAAYPRFGNDDVTNFAPKVVTRWGVQPYTFAPKEETFRFLEGVLDEVCGLFPSRFIHIGGDEAPKKQWKQSPFAQSVMRREHLQTEEELQSWFVRRIETYLSSKHRRLVGWDEIQEGGLPKTATLMAWRDAKWARHALSLGNDVVMATTTHTYLDYYQAPALEELARGKQFEAIGGLLPLQKVYSYNPAFVAENPDQEKHILGTQGQVWGEYVKDGKKAEYMAYPRLTALAEVAWSAQADRDYAGFTRRLQTHLLRLNALGVNYYRPPNP